MKSHFSIYFMMFRLRSCLCYGTRMSFDLFAALVRPGASISVRKVRLIDLQEKTRRTAIFGWPNDDQWLS